MKRFVLATTDKSCYITAEKMQLISLTLCLLDIVLALLSGIYIANSHSNSDNQCYNPLHVPHTEQNLSLVFDEHRRTTRSIHRKGSFQIKSARFYI